MLKGNMSKTLSVGISDKKGGKGTDLCEKQKVIVVKLESYCPLLYFPI